MKNTCFSGSCEIQEKEIINKYWIGSYMDYDLSYYHFRIKTCIKCDKIYLLEEVKY